MSAENLIAGLQEEVMADNMSTYRRIFETSSSQQVRDPYWKRALALYSTLSEEHRKVLFEIVRQVQVDTVSNVLGVIDGVNRPRSLQETRLTLLANGENIEGDLQALFLADNEKTAKG
jgi:putative transposase